MQSSNDFINKIPKNQFHSKDSILNHLFSEYERVIMESIISSFGLEFLMTRTGIQNDQYGGDVDTIHNVRKIGIDYNMNYKNKKNEHTYNNKKDYNSTEYHDKNKNYKDFKDDAKRESRANDSLIKDAYTGKDITFQKSAPPKMKANLDHAVSAKSIHDDRGRVLADLSGADLANRKENLYFTNESLNKSMGKDDIGEYINSDKTYVKQLTEEDKQRMLNAKKTAELEIDRKINAAYYTSAKFRNDVIKSSVKSGVKMGVRQALGFVFLEIWISVKEELSKSNNNGFNLEKTLNAIGNGVKKGSENAKLKYKEFFTTLKDGTLNGIISSVVTTVCNIFFTTAKRTVKLIRQCWGSLTEATNILLFNPDDFELGDRIQATAKVIAMGGSIAVGIIVEENVPKLGLGLIPSDDDDDDILPSFLGALSTGIMSCTLLLFLDHNEMIKKAIHSLNSVPTIERTVNYYKEQSRYFSEYCGELMEFDKSTFEKEVNVYKNSLSKLSENMTESDMNKALKEIYLVLGIELPWKDDFDDFMGNKSNRLQF